MMMGRHPTTEQLIDYIHGALTPADDAAVHAHLSTCSHCRREYQAETQLSELLRAEAAARTRELPASVRAGIWAAVRRPEPAPWSWLGAVLRPAFAIPAIAVLVIATYAVTPLGHPRPTGPTVDVSYYLEQHAAQALQVPLSDRSAPNATAAAVFETSGPAVSASLPSGASKVIEAAMPGADVVR
jgi:anti-sigma factor RsiW